MVSGGDSSRGITIIPGAVEFPLLWNIAAFFKKIAIIIRA